MLFKAFENVTFINQSRPTADVTIYKIILDTNILLAPAQYGVDIFTEIERLCMFSYDLYMLDRTMDELLKITAESRKGKDKDAAKLAISIVKAKNIKTISTDEPEKDVDTLIVDSTKKGCIVATLDKELRDRVREKHIPIIYMRNRHLELEMFT